jgi:hypothetical protein
MEHTIWDRRSAPRGAGKLRHGFGIIVRKKSSAHHSAVLAGALLIVTAIGLVHDRNRLLGTPIYLAYTMDWMASTTKPELPGFVSIPALEPDEQGQQYGLAILIPEAFPKADRSGKQRVLVIDDSITSGVVPPKIRQYLCGDKIGYDKKNVRVACCACVKNVLLGEADRRPNYDPPLKPETNDFQWPWGPPIWFPRRTLPDGDKK